MRDLRTYLRRISTFQFIIFGFVALILLGTLLLMLPFSTRAAGHATFADAVFTATSAVCVTGLVVQDTASYWTEFGQAIILLLIQIGGLGVVSIVVAFSALAGRKISLLQRSTMQDAISAPQVGGIMKLTSFIFRVAFLIEFVGMLLLLPVFCVKYQLKGIWISMFLSISAFCNAGFDILGTISGPFSSLTSLAENGYFIVVISLLIIIGGIGFLTWDDIVLHKWKFKKYRMQSKVVLVTTGLLLIIPFGIFFFSEYSNLPIGTRILVSFFQSVTTRTAGFNTADLSCLSGVGVTMFVILMMIGGSPGSTAGGMKTTTAAVLFGNMISIFHNKKSVEFFGRRIEDTVVKSVSTILMLYTTLALTSAMIISSIEGLPMSLCLFETASAIGTAGLSMGITTSLGSISRFILILLMFFGRAGSLTLIYAAKTRKVKDVFQRPVETISVG